MYSDKIGLRCVTQVSATLIFVLAATECSSFDFPGTGTVWQRSRLRSAADAYASSAATMTVSYPQSRPNTFPLPPHTFSGLVEQGLIERFVSGIENGSHRGDDDTVAIARVLESWRLLDRDYVHNAYVGSDPTVDPSLSKCHQLCHSYVPGLRTKEFWDPTEFPWCAKLKSKYKAIHDEFSTVTADREALQQAGNNVWAGALSADASSYGEDWRTVVLMNRGVWDPVNVNLFPVAAKAVHDSGAPVTEVFFASMNPHSSIKPHSDFTNFVLTSHLAIDIPYSGENKCRLSVGDTEKEWINGQVTLFDTSIMHDAVNESDKMRYILMMRVWHPDLTQVERKALQFTFNALEYPDLVSADPTVKANAEVVVQASLAFPKIKKGRVQKQGFGSSAGLAKKTKKGSKR